MTPGPRPGGGSGRAVRRLVAPLLALLLSVVAPLIGSPGAVGPGPAGTGTQSSPVPPAFLTAPVALAADDDGLDIRSDTRYVVQPDAGVVAVTVDLRVTNTSPNRTVSTPSGPAISYSFYEGVLLGVQPEAVRVRATEGNRSLTVKLRQRSGYDVVEIRFRQPLYYRDTVAVRLRYDLEGGAPRSTSSVRVMSAFVSFVAWAFGDQGSVRIDLPSGFAVDSTEGDPLEQTAEDGHLVLNASSATPDEWYAWVAASSDAALTRDRLELPEGRVVIRAWPEDAAWRAEVSDVIGRGVPILQDLIGLEWPVVGELDVVEIHTPLLEGYAGFFDPGDRRITMSEEIDDHTIIHEISHAWFDEERFGERWIFEGLADEYAARVLDDLGLEVRNPEPVTRADPAAFALTGWGPPTRIDDEETDAREQYGYDASWALMRQIVDRAGEDGMRAVFAASETGAIVYVGAGPAEQLNAPSSWQWFLDAVEELGGATGVDELILEWAVSPEQADPLAARSAARAAYHDLVGAGDGWLPGFAVREPLATWRFDVAASRIDDARAVLARRDEIGTRADSEDLRPPDSLRAAYQGAWASLDGALDLATELEASLDAVERAGDAVGEPRDWLLELGLLGEAPEAMPDMKLAAARAAWEAGDLELAVSAAAAAEQQLVAAPQTGRTRAIVAGGAAAGGAIVLGGTTVALRRHRRRRALGRPGTDQSDAAGGSSEPLGAAALAGPRERPDESLGAGGLVGPEGPPGESGTVSDQPGSGAGVADLSTSRGAPALRDEPAAGDEPALRDEPAAGDEPAPRGPIAAPDLSTPWGAGPAGTATAGTPDRYATLRQQPGGDTDAATREQRVEGEERA